MLIEVKAGTISAWIDREITVGQAEEFYRLQDTFVESASGEYSRAMRQLRSMIAIGVERWQGFEAGADWPGMDCEDDIAARLAIASKLSISQAKKISEAIAARMHLDDDEEKESAPPFVKSTG
tara:strand:+ start:3994 stop:4362 length:369 start_codon:yes stop_codon:yes gene_type:complete